jgi:hypothetical protein
MNRKKTLRRKRRRSPFRNGGGYEFSIGGYTIKSDSIFKDPTVYDSKGNVSKIGTFIAKHRNKPVVSRIINTIQKLS